MPDAAKQIDTRINIPTPENIEFAYRLAGPFRRLPAFLLDWLIRIVAVVAVLMVFGRLIPPALFVMVFLITLFILEWFYGALFETYMNGQTPGKWLLGIRVITKDGRPINGMQAVLRNILRFVDTMPLLSGEAFFRNAVYIFPTFIVGLYVMMATRRFQRLGDLVCGTIVVVEERQWLTGIAKIEDPRAFELASYLPADFEMSRSMALAISHYVERRRFFSNLRRREVASALAVPLLEHFGFPRDTNYDLLLCALYYRTFIADRGEDEKRAAEARAAGGIPVATIIRSESEPLYISE